MKMMKIVLSMVVIGLLISACGGDSPKGPKRVYQPDWYDVQDDPEYVHTFGKAEKVSENAAYNAAYANAMLQAAQYVESYVKGMVKNYNSESGVENPQVLASVEAVVKVVSNSKFANTMVTKRETIMTENNRYKTFVRVSIPKEAVNKNLVNQIKNEEALYNQFKASQAFEELEKEVEKY
jgi:hypothetical protein